MATVPRRADVLKTIRQLASRQRELGVSSLGSTDVPTGTALLWPTAIALPEGLLEANDQNVSRDDFEALFAVYGTDFGAGDGSTTFGLPNLTGAPTGFRYVIRA